MFYIENYGDTYMYSPNKPRDVSKVVKTCKDAKQCKKWLKRNTWYVYRDGKTLYASKYKNFKIAIYEARDKELCDKWIKTTEYYQKLEELQDFDDIIHDLQKDLDIANKRESELPDERSTR